MANNLIEKFKIRTDESKPRNIIPLNLQALINSREAAEQIQNNRLSFEKILEFCQFQMQRKISADLIDKLKLANFTWYLYFHKFSMPLVFLGFERGAPDIDLNKALSTIVIERIFTWIRGEKRVAVESLKFAGLIPDSKGIDRVVTAKYQKSNGQSTAMDVSLFPQEYALDKTGRNFFLGDKIFDIPDLQFPARPAGLITGAMCNSQQGIIFQKALGLRSRNDTGQILGIYDPHGVIKGPRGELGFSYADQYGLDSTQHTLVCAPQGEKGWHIQIPKFLPRPLVPYNL